MMTYRFWSRYGHYVVGPVLVVGIVVGVLSAFGVVLP